MSLNLANLGGPVARDFSAQLEFRNAHIPGPALTKWNWPLAMPTGRSFSMCGTIATATCNHADEDITPLVRRWRGYKGFRSWTNRPDGLMPTALTPAFNRSRPPRNTNSTRQAMGAGRLERRVRLVGREIWILLFALVFHSAQYAEYRYCALPRYFCGALVVLPTGAVNTVPSTLMHDIPPRTK